MHNSIFEEIKQQKNRGVFLVLTGPTGSGKDALYKVLLDKNPNLERIITTTSREKRSGESEGNPYNFVTREKFEGMIANKEFFEWVEFRGNLNGTPKTQIDNALNSGQDTVWKIEAKGVKNMGKKIKEIAERSIFVYLTAPSIETLHERVKKDEGQAVDHRWNESLVIWEMEQYDDCDYLVVNEDGKLEEAAEKVLAIMEAKRLQIVKKES